jgi:hypothetical protein
VRGIEVKFLVDACAVYAQCKKCALGSASERNSMQHIIVNRNLGYIVRSVLTRHGNFVLDSLFSLQYTVGLICFRSKYILTSVF